MRPPARLLAPMALVVAAAALVGCSGSTPAPDPEPTIPPGITAPPPTVPPTEAPQIDSTLPDEIAGVDTSAWQQVPAVGDVATFRIPPEWTVQPISGGVAVLRQDGQQQLALTIAATGERPDATSCVDGTGTPVAWRTAMLDRQDVELAGAPGMAFGAAALQLGDQWVVSVGIRPAADAQSPRCPIVNGVETPGGFLSFGSETVVTGSGTGAPWAVASLAAAEDYLGTDEYATIRAILMSLELLP